MLQEEFKHMKFPVIVQKGFDGFYTAECFLFDGCFTQGKTSEEALENIREVIDLCLEEEESRVRARSFNFNDINLHVVTL